MNVFTNGTPIRCAARDDELQVLDHGGLDAPDRGGAGWGRSRGPRSSGPRPSISSAMSRAWPSDRLATSMCEVPAYRRVGPVARGQQAISRLSKPVLGGPAGDIDEGRIGERGRQEAELHGCSQEAALTAAGAGSARPRRGTDGGDVHPAALAGGPLDRVAEEHLVMSVRERRECRMLRASDRRRWPRRSPGTAHGTCPRSPPRGLPAGWRRRCPPHS